MILSTKCNGVYIKHRQEAYRLCTGMLPLILQINGKDLSGLTSQDVLELLMGPEKHVSLLLFREPSVTLL